MHESVKGTEQFEGIGKPPGADGADPDRKRSGE